MQCPDIAFSSSLLPLILKRNLVVRLVFIWLCIGLRTVPLYCHVTSAACVCSSMRHERPQALRGERSEPLRLRPHREEGPHRAQGPNHRQQAHYRRYVTSSPKSIEKMKTNKKILVSGGVSPETRVISYQFVFFCFFLIKVLLRPRSK